MTSTEPQPAGTRIEATGNRNNVADSIGVAISGDGARVVMLPVEAVHWAREVEAPPGAGHLPGSASGVFLGRQDELAKLRGLLSEAGDVAVTQAAQTRAIHGLGGIGKSALALHYAHTYRTSYTLVWWITAETTDQIVTGLAGLALRLCPQWATTADVQERAAWAILWLQWHPGWLLVFDNVEDPDDLRHYLGMLPDGHHLATSRKATGWQAIAPTMPLELLTAEASLDLLCTLAFGDPQAPSPGQREQAKALAAELGYLPLALEQASAYLFETGTDLADYRALLGQVLDTAAGGIDPERTIARIWHHTLAAIDSRNPQAVSVLHVMAWLAPDGIPRSLLAPLFADVLTLGEALGVLHAYNMISFSVDRRTVTIHRLVQAVLQHRAITESGDDPPGRYEAGRLIRQALPTQDNATEPWEQLLPHVFALAVSVSYDSPTSAETAYTYEAAAQYLDLQGRNAHTIPLRAATLAQCEQVLGDTHPDTLRSRDNLANAYQSAGDLERAIPLSEAILAQREQLLGLTHPDTLVSRNNLARIYESAGDVVRSIPLFEATLAQSEQVLGDTHPDTLISRNNLANAYQSAGDLERAIPLFEATLAQREQVLGETHPSTLMSRNNLASSYQAAGDLERAIPLLEATLTQYEQVLGDSHPATLTSCNNLASSYQAAGDLERAIPLFEATLAQCEQVLGDTHPDTLMSRNNLASAYRAAGDLERAIPLFEATLAQREQVLGDTHPSTLISRNNLGNAYQSAGDLERAIPLFEATLAQREQVLGDTHPDTLTSRNNLASTYESAGDLERAIPLFEATVAQYEQVLGDTHPSTLISRNNLASAYRAAGDLERAIPLFEATLAQREQVLGDTHPDTLTSRNNLASTYESAGDLERAIPLFEATLAQYEQVLGDTHPSTLISRNNLANIREAAAAVQHSDTATPMTDVDLQHPPGPSEQPE
ncbi:tetratricopeptide repeat protein [Streptomyces cinerochromogenes]|uniref:tetratricopeptide repeat protein n=1 Tax=Streptomyces cinerochromogenes TaxID=66422 RepID=UPI0033B644E4